MFSFSTDVVFSQLNDLFQLAQLLLASARNSIAFFSLALLHRSTQTHVYDMHTCCTLFCANVSMSNRRDARRKLIKATMTRLAPRLVLIWQIGTHKCDKRQMSERKKRLNDIVEINFNLQWYAFECVYVNCLCI